MHVTSPTRSERKEATRQAILDAALRLSEETGLAGLSLRAVAKEVGIVPTAFYRHFASIEEVGLALATQAFASLRHLLRDLRRDMNLQRVIDDSVEILMRHVAEHRAHFLFIGRERIGGLASVRSTIRHEIGLFERELAMDVARLPEVAHWSSEDLQALANLIVKLMVETATDVINTSSNQPEQLKAIQWTAERQLRMTVVGAANWDRPGRQTGP